MNRTLKVLITNAATKTVFSFLPALCSGDVFGNNQNLHLVLFAFKPLIGEVETLANDLRECCFPCLEKIETTMDVNKAFQGVDVAILFELERNVIGFKTNAVLFRSYGLILNRQTNKNIKVVVCGRTASTSAFICSSFTPSIDPRNFTCLLQHVKHHLISALKMTSHVDLSNVFVWGSCSDPLISIQKEDGTHICQKDLKICPKSPGSLVTAKALSEHLRFWLAGDHPVMGSKTEEGNSFSMGIMTSGGHLGIHDNLYFGFPTDRSHEPLGFSRVLKIDESFLRALSESSAKLLNETEAAIVDCWRVVLPLSHM